MKLSKYFVPVLGCLVLIGGLFTGTHIYLSENPVKTVIFIDSSYSMEASQERILRLVDSLTRKRYRRFALFTDKSPVYGWTSSPRPLRSLKFYGPEDFSLLTGDTPKEIIEADKVYLITNSSQIPDFAKRNSVVRVIKP